MLNVIFEQKFTNLMKSNKTFNRRDIGVLTSDELVVIIIIIKNKPYNKLEILH
jgi:hypothetical protein